MSSVPQQRETPGRAVWCTLRLFASSRVRLSRWPQWPSLTIEGVRYRAFRRVQVRQGKRPSALLVVRFHPRRMRPWLNRGFSWLTLPFFLGRAGFVGKVWMDAPDGGAMGLYEWSSADAARAYARSYAMRFMAARSTLGTTSALLYERCGLAAIETTGKLPEGPPQRLA